MDDSPKDPKIAELPKKKMHVRCAAYFAPDDNDWGKIMNRLAMTAVSCFATCLLLVPMTFAQTPDGETPMNEGICDGLQSDDVTKGLYGLCVAFCEAQDHASVEVPISESEFEELLTTKPAGRILVNYNKKKDNANNPNDPDMPCVKVEEPCPCWTTEELQSIDGILFDGTAAVWPGLTSCDLVDVHYPEYGYSRSQYRVFEDSYRLTEPADRYYTIAMTYQNDFGGVDRARCQFSNRKNNVDGAIISRSLSRANGELTTEQYAACQNAIVNHIELIRSSCNHGNQQP